MVCQNAGLLGEQAASQQAATAEAAIPKQQPRKHDDRQVMQRAKLPQMGRFDRKSE